MAGKKGRSGRKKATVKKSQQQRREPVAEFLPPVVVEPPPVEKEEKPLSLFDKMKDKIKGLLPEQTEPLNPQSESPTPSASSGSTPEFEVIAERLEEKYEGVSGEPAAAASGPEVVTLGPGHVIPPSMVESWLVLIFGGLEKAHGKHWQLSETDKTVLVPVYTSAIDEQAPLWLAENPNRNAWIAVLVTVFLILSRTKSGGRLVEWGIDKVSTLVSRVGGTTKAG